MGIEERELNEFNRADIIAGKIQQIRANIKALEEEYPLQRTRGEAYQKRRNQYLRMMKQYTDEFVKLISLRDLYKVIIPRTTASPASVLILVLILLDLAIFLTI